MDFYTHRPRPIDEVFPWDHIDVAVKKKFLVEDYLMSQDGETRVDCREPVLRLRHFAEVQGDADGNPGRRVGVPAGGAQGAAQSPGGSDPADPALNGGRVNRECSIVAVGHFLLS